INKNFKLLQNFRMELKCMY
uniref:Uncharacterized protein n=1 Tax=Amphimedon queenslandica TaxID=400682 RepID=A0A1X7U024_AMPQE